MVDFMLSVLTQLKKKKKEAWERPLSSLKLSSTASQEYIAFFAGLSHQTFPLKFKIIKYYFITQLYLFL